MQTRSNAVTTFATGWYTRRRFSGLAESSFSGRMTVVEFGECLGIPGRDPFGAEAG